MHVIKGYERNQSPGGLIANRNTTNTKGFLSFFSLNCMENIREAFYFGDDYLESLYENQMKDMA